MSRIVAVLFDWRGTLAHSPPPGWWAQTAATSIGRRPGRRELAAMEAALDEAGDLPGIDVSTSVHRDATLRVFAEHGLDPALAEALYTLDADPRCHQLYPDALEVLRELRHRDVAVAVVSDFHADLRPALAAQGAPDLVGAWVISYEHGIQKPAPRMFKLALDALGVAAGQALMVGDRATHDGPAATIGIPTLILPPPPAELERRGLAIVLRLAVS